MISSFLLRHSRLTLLGALAFALAGIVSWFGMPRQEDPEISVRGGMAIIPYPGADALTIERLIAKPVEEQIQELDAVEYVKTTVRDGVAIFQVELGDQITQSDAVWDDVDTQIQKARDDEFPPGVGPTQTEWELYDLASVVVAVTGSPDPLVLKRGADALAWRLRQQPGVASVEVTADPGEQVTISFDAPRARAFGVSAEQLAGQLRAQSTRVPGGWVQVQGMQVGVDTKADHASLRALRETPVFLPTGGVLALGELATVRREVRQPRASFARFNGQAAVMVSVVPKERLDVVKWGRQIRQELDALRASLAPLKLEVVTFQPDYVKRRLDGLGLSLLQAVGIVALLLCLTMGVRMGLAVAVVVPFVALSALFVFSFSGGLLQQFSIAGLVVSLGLLVDNAIVVSERIQEHLDAGVGRVVAARQAMEELAWPLTAATGTTVAAFLPLLLSQGPVGEFTRGIPWLVSVTLVVSLAFALGVTPLLCVLLLRPRAGRQGAAERSKAVVLISRLPVAHPWKTLGLAVVVVGLTLPLATMVRQEFFPLADREQILIELELAEGTHLDHTDAQISRLEEALLGRGEVASVATFVGRSTPRFYYNLPLRPDAPQLAQMLVTLKDASSRWGVVDWARGFGQKHYPGAKFLARILEQGPPTAAPIEVRLYGEDPAALTQATHAVSAVLMESRAVQDVRHDLPYGRPTLVLDPQDAVLLWQQKSRAQMGSLVWGRTHGLDAGHLRDGQDPVPLIVRTGGPNPGPQELWDLEFEARGHRLDSVSGAHVEVRPAAIHRRQGKRVVSVLAQVRQGRGFDEVVGLIGPRLKALGIQGVRHEIGGAPEASLKANRAIGAAAPYGVIALLGCLLLQFGSFRRTFVILLTIPLAAVGVIPGLVVWSQPFGFQSLLGVLSLVGIVVNNAIILLDTFDQNQAQGLALRPAIELAVRSRLRPILLTTATTIFGLTPLLWSDSALWPPMASAMITGLAASTTLTLVVLPAVCVLMFSPWLEHRRTRLIRTFLASAVLLIVLSGHAVAQEGEEAQALTMTLEQVIDVAQSRAPEVLRLQAQVGAVRAGSRAAWRGRWLPGLSVQAQGVRRSEVLALQTPLGPFVQRPLWDAQLALVVDQPLLDLGSQWAEASEQEAKQGEVEAVARRTGQMIALQGARLHLAQLKLLATLKALAQQRATLLESLNILEVSVAAGRGLESDLLEARVRVRELEVERVRLQGVRAGLAHTLAGLLGRRGAVYAAPLTGRQAVVTDQAFSALPLERGDLQVVAAKQAQVAARMQALRLDWVPTVSLQGRVIHQVNSPLVEPTWAEGAVSLSWTPWASGTRGALLDGLEAEGVALSHEARAITLSQEAELSRLRQMWQVHQEQVVALEEVVKMRQEIVARVSAQHTQGRVIFSEVLGAQAALAMASAKLQIARLERVEREIEARFERE